MLDGRVITKVQFKPKEPFNLFNFPRSVVPNTMDLCYSVIRLTPSHLFHVCVKFSWRWLSFLLKYANTHVDWCEYMRKKSVISENSVPKLLLNLPSYFKRKMCIKSLLWLHYKKMANQHYAQILRELTVNILLLIQTGNNENKF